MSESCPVIQRPDGGHRLVGRLQILLRRLHLLLHQGELLGGELELLLLPLDLLPERLGLLAGRPVARGSRCGPALRLGLRLGEALLGLGEPGGGLLAGLPGLVQASLQLGRARLGCDELLGHVLELVLELTHVVAVLLLLGLAVALRAPVAALVRVVVVVVAVAGPLLLLALGPAVRRSLALVLLGLPGGACRAS